MLLKLPLYQGKLEPTSVYFSGVYSFRMSLGVCIFKCILLSVNLVYFDVYFAL